jgi:microcystin-dependent protein
MSNCCNKTGTPVPTPAHCCPSAFCHDGLINLPARRVIRLTGVETGKKCLSRFDETSIGFVVGTGDGQMITTQPVVPVPFLQNLILGEDGRPMYNSNGTIAEDVPPGVNDLLVSDGCGKMWRWHGKNGQRQKPVWNGCQWVVEADYTEAELGDFPNVIGGGSTGYKEAILKDKGGGVYELGYRQTPSRFAGEISQFAGPVDRIPPGWLVCDGSAKDGLEFPELFAAIGYYWGKSGDMFRLPDLRGRFLRGVDDGSGNDPDAGSRFAQYTTGATGDNVGSYQKDAFQKHKHEFLNTPTAGTGGGTEAGIETDAAINDDGSIGEVGNASEATAGPPRTANETRPVNAAVFFIIYGGEQH